MYQGAASEYAEDSGFASHTDCRQRIKVAVRLGVFGKSVRLH